MSKVNLNILLAVCVLIMALAGPAGAVTTWYVDPNGSADFNTIQEAIFAAFDYDEIEVAPGTYYETIDFIGKPVKLYSRDGQEVTIIEGSYVASHVVQCISDEGPDTILEGFTISGGHAFLEGGGGMYNYYSSPTVNDCNFIYNESESNGGGMYNEGGSPIVTNCKFYDNLAGMMMEGGNGGGMYNNSSSPTVTNCTFMWNGTLLPEGGGGGMYNSNSSSPTVTNCTFISNPATLGGGMCNSSSNPTVTNCTFSNNLASLGGGMFNSNSSSPTVTNCIFWGNIYDEIYDDVSSSTTVSYSDVQGGWGGTGGNNINANPVFGGDLRLGACSPCVDAGSNSGVPGGVTTDLDGNPRFVDDTGVSDTGAGTPPIVDMGAYERQANSVVWGTINVPGDFNSIQEAINEAYIGDQIIVAPGTYYEVVDFKGKAIRLYSSGGPQVTTIDGTGYFQYHVVKCISGEDANTILAGFTITGGNANGSGTDKFGGGMYCENSSPTVTNCTFSGNSAEASGGGMYNYNNSSPTVINCTFTGNDANNGGGIYNVGSSPQVTNCIFWGDTPNEIVDDPCSMSVVTYSNIQGGWSAEGNIDANPFFRNLNKGNLLLAPGSPCIDAGNNAVVSPNAIDINSMPRLVDGDCNAIVTVDMGAYEFQRGYGGDFDSSCLVDLVDFAVLARAWLTDPLSDNWDSICDISIPADESIDYSDLKVLGENWLDNVYTLTTCDAKWLKDVFGVDSATIFGILGAAHCLFSTEAIVEKMKEAGCTMLELVEIDADESGQAVIPDGFHALGSYSFTTTAGCQFAARELVPGMLANPLDYVQVTDTDYWKPVPPTGYVWLGLVENSVKPDLDDVKCVKEQLACPGTFGVGIDPEENEPNHIIPADTNGIYIGTFGLSDCAPLYVVDERIVQKPEYLTLQDIDQLIQAYGPVLKLHPGEDYFLDDPEWVLDNGVELEYGLVEGYCKEEKCYDTFTKTDVNSIPTSSATLMDDVEYVINSIKPNPPYNSSDNFKYWLNIPYALKPGNLSRAKTLVRVVPWNHFFTEIQFWFFYPFNGPARVRICLSGYWCDYINLEANGRHYGDWEHVTLRFLNSSKELVSVYMSAHGGGHWFGAGDFGDTLQFQGLHPVVYSGKYSHAHYPTADTYYYERIITADYYFGTFSADLYDVTDNGLEFPSYLVDNYSIVSYDVYPVPTPDWLGFTARWGQYEKLSTSFGFDVGGLIGWINFYTYKNVGAGPYGPPYKPAWQIGASGEALGYE